MDATLRFTVVETAAIPDVIDWANQNLTTGADFYIEPQFKQVQVVVPESLLLSFLELHGWAVVPANK